MSEKRNKPLKNLQINDDTLVRILDELNPTTIESWQEGNFLYSFLRLGNRTNITSHYFLKATNIITKEERAIAIPPSISNGREAKEWATSAR